MRSDKMIRICQDRQLCTTSLGMIIVRQGFAGQFFDLCVFQTLRGILPLDWISKDSSGTKIMKEEMRLEKE